MLMWRCDKCRDVIWNSSGRLLILISLSYPIRYRWRLTKLRTVGQGIWWRTEHGSTSGKNYAESDISFCAHSSSFCFIKFSDVNDELKEWLKNISTWSYGDNFGYMFEFNKKIVLTVTSVHHYVFVIIYE